MAFLMHVRTQGRWVDHPLSDYYVLLSPDQIDVLKSRLVSGDMSVVDPLIKAHLKLMLNIVSRYAVFTNSAEDLMSESCLALIKCCKRLANKEVEYERIDEYFASAIHSACGNFIKCDRLFGPSHTTARKHNIVTDRERLRDDLLVATDAQLDLEGLPHQEVLAYRLAGYTLKEIANRVNESITSVHRKIKEIGVELQALWGDDFPRKITVGV
jgi:RNA polymerase sigma factor (sigma-70 family)